MNPREQVVQLANQARERWQALSASRKVVSVLAVAGILASLFYLGGLILTPRYSVLFSNLQAAEAGTIAGKLDQMKVPYQLADQGQTIEVPQSQVYNVRIELASDGTLQNADSGWSLFDSNKFGMTDFEQQVDYQRALQDELRSTIIQMNGVSDAVVNLVIPQKSDFLDQQGTPSASVLLKLQPGTTLTPDQVQGIADLVQGSVEGLKPENIHIVDTNGTILNGDTDSEDQGLLTAATSLTQEKVSQEYDETLQQKVQAMLDQVLGPGQAVCMVNADLNFDQKKVSQVQYQSGKILSEAKTSQTGTGIQGVGGTPGTTGNTSTATPPTYSSSSSGGGTYNNSSDTTNYDVGSTTTSDTQAPGTVSRISTAVVLNSTNSQSVNPNQIQSVVAAAIGYDPARGDQVTVESMPFNTTYAKNLTQQMNQAAATQKQQQLVEMAGAGLLGVILLVTFLVLVLRRRRKVDYESVESGEMVVDTGPPPDELSEEDRKAFFSMDEKLELIRELAKDKPEDVAEIIKVWIKE